VRHTAATISKKFNFIAATRIGNEIRSDYPYHLQNFLTQAINSGIPADTMVSFIASSILMDAYPPRMHGLSRAICENNN
jgi:hypothetical protein